MKKVNPKKHLGQHFLKDEQIAKKIVDALTIVEGQRVLEVGPGTGVLTKYLIERCNDFQAFDVDHESITYLRETYPDHAPKFIHQDFLGSTFENAKLFKVIGNFPYNISSQLFFAIYDHRPQVTEVVCMIQKEVADRITATPGNKTYGILSVLLGAFYDIEYLFTVKPSVFHPPPKVNSAVIRLQRNDTRHLDCDEKLFKRVIKSAFGKRRKTLRNALKDLNLLPSVFEDAVFDKRAEQLSVAEFIQLTKMISTDGDLDGV
ncbi:MAG: 16S rRNA (adenine(1518)-N(6)/adenine(1519)-N(6))-dimethyltransferase RsmA [Cyclobacteriaceae bacterium]|nr:16S rRNA (adenine(1518)-N(6)/adenine(1519)-N(6))-dimethyltransferase RsmA [Cyclobacteriaceae bacterium HetDA_MAG_MS6]